MANVGTASDVTTVDNKYSGKKAGRLITPNLPGIPGGRFAVLLSESDYERWTAAGYGGETGTAVVDLLTNTPLMLRRADCGAGCKCATEPVYMDWPVLA